MSKVYDPIRNPDHYQGKEGMVVIDAIRNFAPSSQHEQGFYWGNVIKYLLRYSKKNGLEDLKKAHRNLAWLIESVEREEKHGD